jgi:branched-chain amino acid aminotransferase
VKVWIDDEIVDGDEARIPVTDHGLLYGDGIFEGIRVYRNRVFRLDAHMKRFEAGARAIALELPGGIDAVRAIVLATVRAFGADEAYVRLIATRGEGSLGVDPTTCPQPRLICLVDHVRIYPPDKLSSGLDLVTSSLRRPSPDVLDPRIKSLNYLNNVLAKLEARQRGADEALMLNAQGMIAETSVANVFVVRDGVLLTPPATDGALEGVTRATVMELATTLGIPVREQTLSRFDFFAAEEAFLTGSGAGIVPIRSLDARAIGSGRPGPIFEKVRVAFSDAVAEFGTSLIAGSAGE